jgi:putative ABC transport system ATP-binding protein
MIEVKDLCRWYGDGESKVVALDGVSLSIQENEFVAIMGSSGSGKSTLMNILGCLDSANKGQYQLAGKDVKHIDDESLSLLRNQKIGFIFQSFHLLPRLSALENVLLPLRYSRSELNAKHPDMIEKAIKILTRVGLGHRLDHKPFEMSGGQRQRVAIARSLINDPEVIFADEPTGNLDSKTSHDIMTILSELHQSGQTIVMVTHEEDIAAYAERVITMRDGKVLSDVKNSQQQEDACLV